MWVFGGKRKLFKFFLITKFLDQLIILSLDYEFKIKLKLCTTKIAHWWKKTVEYIFFYFSLLQSSTFNTLSKFSFKTII